MKLLIWASINDTKEILTEALLYRIKNANDDINNSDINKVIAARSPKEEVGIWPVIIIVIASRK